MAEQAYPTPRHLSAPELKSYQPNVFFVMLHGLVYMGILRGLVSYSLMQEPQSMGYRIMLLAV